MKIAAALFASVAAAGTRSTKYEIDFELNPSKTGRCWARGETQSEQCCVPAPTMYSSSFGQCNSMGCNPLDSTCDHTYGSGSMIRDCRCDSTCRHSNDCCPDFEETCRDVGVIGVLMPFAPAAASAPASASATESQQSTLTQYYEILPPAAGQATISHGPQDPIELLTQLVDWSEEMLNNNFGSYRRKDNWVKKFEKNSKRMLKSLNKKCATPDAEAVDAHSEWILYNTTNPSNAINDITTGFIKWSEAFIGQCKGQKNKKHNKNRMSNWNTKLKTIFSKL